MAGFSSEEILDLLYKKVAFGANKSGRSEEFTPAGETSSSFIAVKPSSIWREADTTNVPVVPPSATSAYVQVYASHTGTQPGSTTAVATCTPNGDAPAMPLQTNFKRSWKTGATNWLGPTFGAGYLVKVYVGPANWDGDTTDTNITQVIFGSDANRDWYFDYEAGMLYWTPEDENGTGSFEDSDSWTTFTDTHVVYIAGYRYIGATGAGGTSDITGGASTIATNDLTVNRALLSNGDGKVAVSAVTSAELATLSGVSDDIQTQLDNIQNDVDGNESDADAAIAAVQSDVDQNEADADAAIALKLALAGGQMTGNITFSGTQTVDGRDLSADGSKLDGIEANATADQTLADINGLAITTVGDLSSGSIDTGFGDINNGSSTLNTGAATVASLVLGGHTIDDIDITSEFVNDDAHIMSSKAIGAKFALINADTTGTAGALAGGAVGSVPYQSDADTTAFLAGNTAATNLFMRSVGTGAAAQAPTFAAVTATDVGLGNVTNVSQATILSSAASAAATAGDAAYVALAGGSTIGSANPLIFEGATSDGFQTTLAVADPGADRTITLPNATGTVALTANHLGAFANTTSAQLASIITNETGTGALVFADSPALTGTITAAAASFSGDVTVSGNLNVIGDGTYINLQQENVYMRDALITLGNEDDGEDEDFADAAAMAAGTLLGIEAYKQNHDNSAHPSLVFDTTVGNKYWAIDNKDHAASALTRVARTFKIEYTIDESGNSDVSNGYFTITHNLNHKDVIVQVRDASDNIVFFKYTSQTVNAVRVAIGGGIADGDVFNVVVVG